MKFSLPSHLSEMDSALEKQLRRNRFQAAMKILEVGCGTGRNLPALLDLGCQVFGVDCDVDAVATGKFLSLSAAPQAHWIMADLENLPFREHSFDAVLSLSVLHFARDQVQFEAMLMGSWRVLRPGGLFLAHTDCSSDQKTPWFLAGEKLFQAMAEKLPAIWLEPYLEECSQGRGQATVLWRKPWGKA